MNKQILIYILFEVFRAALECYFGRDLVRLLADLQGVHPCLAAQKDIANNQLIVVEGHDHQLLYQQILSAKDVFWVAGVAPQQEFKCTAKARYRQQDAACHVKVQGEQLLVHFDAPQWAITSGQSIVFYQDEACLGGAVIV